MHRQVQLQIDNDALVVTVRVAGPGGWEPEPTWVAGGAERRPVQGLYAGDGGADAPDWTEGVPENGNAQFELGGRLWAALLGDWSPPPDTETVWLDLPDETAELAGRDPHPARLPWELLRRPDGAWAFNHPRPLWIHGTPPGAAEASDRRLPDRPRRILVLSGVSADNDDIQAAAELHAIERAWWPHRTEVRLRFVSVTRVDQARDALDFQPDLLHIIAHGSVDGVPRLELDEDDWRISDLLVDLDACARVGEDGVARGPILVLSACSSGDGFGPWSFARTAHAAGCPAVLGIRGELNGGDGPPLAEAIHKALAAGDDVIEATRSARHSLAARAPRTWWRLTASLRAELLLARPQADPSVVAPPAAPAPPMADCPDLAAGLRYTVDRHDQRWACVEDLGDASIVAFWGELGTGRTTLIYAALEALAARGAGVRYVDAARVGTLSVRNVVLGLLSEEADASAASRIRAPWPPAASGALDALRDVLRARPGENLELDVIRRHLAELGDAIEFLRPLVVGGDGAQPAKPPLVIALDHLEAMHGEELRRLVLQVLAPLTDEVESLRFLLAVGPAGKDSLARHAPGRVGLVSVQDFEPETWEWYRGLYAQRLVADVPEKGPEAEERLRMFEELFRGGRFPIPERLNPAMLRQMLGLL